jgi:hypothetical protein
MVKTITQRANNDGRHQSDLAKQQTQRFGWSESNVLLESDDGFFTENLEGIKEVLRKGFLQ